jgi:hypothetical protein
MVSLTVGGDSMGCLGLFLAPLGFFVSHPFLALIPALAFLVYYFVRRPAAAAMEVSGQVRWSLVAGLLWTVYTIYELAMHQWSKTVIAPIRIDLFLVGPLLYVLTAGALWSCIAFETAASRGLDPVKPIRPGPYALARNRRFVIGFAIALACYPLLNLLFALSVRGLRDFRGPFLSLLVISVLAVFLVRGYRWARWCLLLWLAYSALNHFIGWSSLRVTSRQDMEIFRIWNLASLVLDIVLGVYLLLSKRLREHLDVHSFRSPPASLRVDDGKDIS